MREVQVYSFPTIQTAIDTILEAKKQDMNIARMEVVDSSLLPSMGKQIGDKDALFVEFHGSSNKIKNQKYDLGKLVKKHSGSWGLNMRNKEKCKSFWSSKTQACWTVHEDSDNPDNCLIITG